MEKQSWPRIKILKSPIDLSGDTTHPVHHRPETQRVAQQVSLRCAGTCRSRVILALPEPRAPRQRCVTSERRATLQTPRLLQASCAVREDAHVVRDVS